MPSLAADLLSNPWLWAIVAVVGGAVIGATLAKVVRNFLMSPRRTRTFHQFANAAASLVLSLCVVVGTLVALAIVDRETLEQLPDSLVGFMPKVMVAGTILLLGNVAATLISTAVNESMLRATGQPRPEVASAVRVAILVLATIFALSQLGVDTSILMILTAGIVFAIALSFALLVGLGGHDLANEMSTGRYVRRIVGTGDRLSNGSLNGEVLAVHPVTIEVRNVDGTVTHIRHTTLLEQPLTVVKAEDPEAVGTQFVPELDHGPSDQ
ncbi:MAG: hypothetical protein KDB86_00350 [Actinobacteria bacterium]|nr:hypothetical protein [Actinomycetota bacterium]